MAPGGVFVSTPGMTPPLVAPGVVVPSSTVSVTAINLVVFKV